MTVFVIQVRFESIGGLSRHISALKEMVVFPLLYPEVFERFKIQPPRLKKKKKKKHVSEIIFTLCVSMSAFFKTVRFLSEFVQSLL